MHRDVKANVFKGWAVKMYSIDQLGVNKQLYLCPNLSAQLETLYRKQTFPFSPISEFQLLHYLFVETIWRHMVVRHSWCCQKVYMSQRSCWKSNSVKHFPWERALTPHGLYITFTITQSGENSGPMKTQQTLRNTWSDLTCSVMSEYKSVFAYYDR